MRRRWGAARQEMVYVHHLVDRMHMGQRQGQFGVVGDLAPRSQPWPAAVDVKQDLSDVQVVALRRQSAIDGAGPHSHKDLVMRPEFAQHLHVLAVAEAAFDQADVAGGRSA